MATSGTADDFGPEADGGVDPADDAIRADQPPPGEVRLAAGIVCFQAVGLLVAVIVLVVKTGSGHPDSLGRALSDTGFALVGAGLLVLAARSILALRPAFRTPLIVLELLALPVGWSLGIQAGRVEYGAPLLLSALAVLYLLFTPSARRALERRF